MIEIILILTLKCLIGIIELPAATTELGEKGSIKNMFCEKHKFYKNAKKISKGDHNSLP